MNFKLAPDLQQNERWGKALFVQLGYSVTTAVEKPS